MDGTEEMHRGKKKRGEKEKIGRIRKAEGDAPRSVLARWARGGGRKRQVGLRHLGRAVASEHTTFHHQLTVSTVLLDAIHHVEMLIRAGRAISFRRSVAIAAWVGC